MLRRIDNYSFKRSRVGKYRKYFNEFIESGLSEMYWQCDSAKEAKCARAGIVKEVKDRKYPNIIVRVSEKDAVVGVVRMDG